MILTIFIKLIIMFTRNYSNTSTINSRSQSNDIICAIATDDLDRVKCLIKSNNVNDIIDEKNGFTALHIAITKSFGPDIVKYLLSIGANTSIETRLNKNSYDLAFDDKKRILFAHASQQKEYKIKELSVKNNTLNANITDLNERNNFLIKSNENYSERLKTLHIKISNEEASKFTKLYDEKSNECNNLKRKVEDLTEKNTKLKRNLDEAENAISQLSKKSKK